MMNYEYFILLTEIFFDNVSPSLSYTIVQKKNSKDTYTFIQQRKSEHYND